MFSDKLLIPGKVNKEKITALNTVSLFQMKYHSELVVKDLEIDDIAFTIFHCKSTRKVVISFKGTDSVIDWERYNLRAGYRKLKLPNQTICCHAGFLKAWENVSQKIVNYLSENSDTIGSILLTGHSLGGAVATIGYLRLKHSSKLPKLRFALVTFGAPCSLILPLNQKIKDTETIYNIINLEDPVPLLPFWFQSPGNKIYIEPKDEGFKTTVKEKSSFCMWFKYFRYSKKWSSHDMETYNHYCKLL